MGAAVFRAVGVGGAAVVLGATGAVGGFVAAGAGDIRAVLASDGVDGGVGAVAFRAVVAGGAVVFAGVTGAVGGFLWAGAGDIRAVLASDGADGAVAFGDAAPPDGAESARCAAAVPAAGTFPAALFAVASLPLPAGVSVVIVTVPSCARAPDAP
ncbi:hypothetical protein [Streptomyces sp. NPDC014806]|uniref:hypothetical protein n=1 Tax=Streptomyces sp. NPDC014806 TaxID=3364920 RepID=UPI0036FF36B4